MTEAKRWRVEAEEERVGRVWGSEAWGDILPTVFHLLPPRERFLVQRVSRLFQGASRRARLAVDRLEMSDINLVGNDTDDFKITAKILDPNAYDGITSLRLPNKSSVLDSRWFPEFLSISEQEYESRLENSQRKCEEALAKLSLPTLRHVSLSTGPLTQSLLPFLRSNPSISSLKLTMVEHYCVTKEVKMIAESLPGAKIRQLTLSLVGRVRVGDSSHFKDWGESLFANVEKLSLLGVNLCNLDFLPNPSKLTSLHYEISRFHRISISFLDQASALRYLSLKIGYQCDIEYAKHIRRLPLESLKIGFGIPASETVHVKAIIERLASSGETSNLAMHLQELTVSIRGSPDLSVFDTDAFLRFPRLHSLRLQLESWQSPPPSLAERNALSALSVFIELKRRLRVLEISVVGQDF